jgi:hypothetical protein
VGGGGVISPPTPSDQLRQAQFLEFLDLKKSRCSFYLIYVYIYIYIYMLLLNNKVHLWRVMPFEK